MIGHAIGALLEFVGVALSPPVFQIAFGIELAAFIVEPMRQFVADGRAGVAVIRRIVHLRIEQRRLQDAGRKVDVVHLRIVIGIHRGRRHLPLAAIHRLANFRQFALGFEQRGALHVAKIIVARDIDGTVVAPFVRISDFVDDSV